MSVSYVIHYCSLNFSPQIFKGGKILFMSHTKTGGSPRLALGLWFAEPALYEALTLTSEKRECNWAMYFTWGAKWAYWPQSCRKQSFSFWLYYQVKCVDVGTSQNSWVLLSSSPKWNPSQLHCSLILIRVFLQSEFGSKMTTLHGFIISMGRTRGEAGLWVPVHSGVNKLTLKHMIDLSGGRCV